jgi:lipopolysaccharide biosynthesis protein
LIGCSGIFKEIDRISCDFTGVSQSLSNKNGDMCPLDMEFMKVSMGPL